MSISKWEPTTCVQPGPSHRGAATPDEIYLEVGRSLHRWEHAESALARLFQVFCESQSVASCRAYGVIEAPFVREQTLRFAGETFFSVPSRADKKDKADLKALLAAYSNASQYRNNIAHGMTVGFYLKEDGSYSGYFLTPPSYASKKVGSLNTSGMHPWFLTYNYYYTASDVMHYTNRFQEILTEAVRLSHHLNDKHGIIPPGSLHP
jgi:hypothetical protein